MLRARDEHPGMSLRDYFAGQVIAGMFADGASFALVMAQAEKSGRTPSTQAARVAFDIADAMVALRHVDEARS